MTFSMTSSALTLPLVISVSLLSGPAASQSGSDRPPGATRSSPGGETAAMSQFPLVYVVRYRPGSAYRMDRPLLQQDLREHERYMRSQTQAGTIAAAGPTFDEAGGLVLINAADRATAELFVQNDPAVLSGIFIGEITDWRPVFGQRSLFRSQDEPAR